MTRVLSTTGLVIWALLGGIIGLSAQSAPEGSVRQVRLEGRQIQIWAPGAGDVEVNQLEKPPRLVVDVRDADHQLPRFLFPQIQQGPIRGLRTSPYRPTIVRLVFDLDHPLSFRWKRQGDTLQIELPNLAQPLAGWSSTAGKKASRPASTDTETRSLPGQQRWGQIRRIHQWVQSLSDSTPEPTSLFELSCRPHQPDRQRARALAREARQVRQGTGLELIGRFEYETEAGQFGEPRPNRQDEDLAGLSGTYAGLRWNLLSGGRADYENQGDLLETRARQARLNARIDTREQQNRCRARKVQERLNQILIELLEYKLELGESWIEATRRAYLSGQLELETLLQAQEEVQEARRRRATRKHNFRARGVEPVRHLPPLIELDFAALEKRIRQDTSLRQLEESGQQLARMREDAQLDTRLSLFGRYEFDQRRDNDSQQFVGEGLAVGVQFSQPLGGPDREAERERTALSEAEIALRRSEWMAGLATVQQRMNEDRGRAVRAHYRQLRWLERVRGRLAQRTVNPGEASLRKALQQTNQLLDATVERVRSLGEVYEEAGRAFEASRQAFDGSMLRVDTLPDSFGRARSGNRSLYVWSKGLQAYSADFLIELTRARRLHRLVVSASQQVPRARLETLLERAKAENVAVELMLSSNQWIYPDRHDQALQRIHNLVQRFQPAWIHLDLEPQALEVPEAREGELRTHYLNLVHKVYERLPDSTRLSASVPVWWPDRMYRDLDDWVSRIYLMAYQDRPVKQRAKRVGQLADLLTHSTPVVALPAQAFPTGWELERAAQIFRAVAGVDEIAVHDLSGWLQQLGDQP